MPYKRQRADYVVVERLDERGRYITDSEFKWLINNFKDRYDPRRLSFALAYTTGLRWDDARTIRASCFDIEFTSMKMGQNKPKRRRKNGRLTLYQSPRNVPIPDWLAADFRCYARYMVMMRYRIKQDIKEFRLFPALAKNTMTTFFSKLRQRHGEKQKWLLDVYQVEKGYDINHELLWEVPRYRVASHACRANYCTAAHAVSGGDYIQGQKLSGHRDVEDYARYVRYNDIMEKKQQIKEEYMETLNPVQQTPLLSNQKRIVDFVTIQ